MAKTERNGSNIEDRPQETENSSETLKLWETPKLKVLPVPNRTQGGANLDTFEGGGYYRPS